MFKYYMNEEQKDWESLFINTKCATPKDWRLSDELGCAQRIAFERKDSYKFYFEGDTYTVEWFNYLPPTLKALWYTDYQWRGGGEFRYYGANAKDIFINANKKTFAYLNNDSVLQEISLPVCRAMIDFFGGLEVK